MTSETSLPAFTAQRCPELAEFLEVCCTRPLAFEGEDPNYHSYLNHTHLWALEYWADHHVWIDLDYRTEFVEIILARWRGRLKGLAPYRQAGYRFYLYEWLSPTISVVAETPTGFPFPGEPQFVKRLNDVMALYVERSWAENFSSDPWRLSRQRILRAIEANKGSISKPSAEALGVKAGGLRILIEQMGLEREVNAIRKTFKRRPATFRGEPEEEMKYACYEERLPAGYR